jgi:hypothetical protein
MDLMHILSELSQSCEFEAEGKPRNYKHERTITALEKTIITERLQAFYKRIGTFDSVDAEAFRQRASFTRKRRDK